MTLAVDIRRAVERRVPDRVVHWIDDLQGEEVILRSAAVAFYAFVAAIPMLVVSAWIFSLFMDDQQIRSNADRIASFAPRDIGAGRLFEAIARAGTSLGVQALVVALVPATAYGAGLGRSFDAFAGSDRRYAPGLIGRVLGLIFVVLVPILLVGGLVAAFAAARIFGRGVVAGLIGFPLGVIGGWVASTISAAVIYRVFPTEPFDSKRLWRAAASAGAGIAVMSALFSLYIRIGADFQARYATSTLAAAVLFVVWLFLANLVLLAAYRLAASHHRH